jgi:tetratricopeptide (TPR) repeat protein
LLCVFAAALAAQDSFEAEFRRGLVALNSNDLAQARRSLENASRLKPDHALVWAALAQTYLHGREMKRANEAAERAAALASSYPTASHALAMFYSEAGDYAKAADWERRFASGPAADPLAGARASHLLGLAYAAANQPVDAERELHKAVEADPSSDVFVFDLGQAQLHAGDFSGALATFERARRQFPSSAQIELAYGVAAYGQRRFPEAIDAFLRVTRLDPSVEQPYVFLARILDQTGDRLPRVVEAYAGWAKAEPRNYLPACLYAKALAAAGADPAQIEAELRHSIQLNGRYWESHFELGVLLARKREFKGAAAELSRSIELNPNNAPAHFQLARVYDRLGQRERAQAERAEHQRLTVAETGVGEKRSP